MSNFNEAINERLPLVKVVEWLEKRNPEAAKYAREHGSPHATDIDRLFTWRETPYGHTFWSELNDEFDSGRIRGFVDEEEETEY